jgi:hypothetical protein
MRHLAEVRAKYPPGLIPVAEFARLMGVTKPGVHQAIKQGRIPVYDAAGAPVNPNDRVRKFLKPGEAAVAWLSSRKRIDGAVDESLVAHRIVREGGVLLKKLAAMSGKIRAPSRVSRRDRRSPPAVPELGEIDHTLTGGRPRCQKASSRSGHS